MRNSGSDQIRLTGRVHSVDYFRFVERDETDWQAWTDVLRGKVAGAIFRGVLTPDVCEHIRRNFWSSPMLQSKEHSTRDADYWCGNHLFTASSLDWYLDEADRARTALETLCAGPGRTPLSLLDEYRDHLADRGIRLRLAEHQGRRAAPFRVRSRGDHDALVLAPHDDAEAIRHARHIDGCEVKQVSRLCNALMCVENGSGGELLYWNISPDRESRAALGMSTDSYGYPIESLSGIEQLTVPVHAGDVYVFDTANVHAVAPCGSDRVHRTTINLLMGQLDEETTVYWS
ncbi:hypothetical protein ACFVT2_37980 [Streptomyces sp. NPDC058000]|uniref:hypothetical protein n=1 Tax=Streptomyces sp. NPDC058000 TaxID=3346299 RepID=UPI0036E1CA0C